MDESLPFPKNSEQKHPKIGAFKTFSPFFFGMLQYLFQVRPAVSLREVPTNLFHLGKGPSFCSPLKNKSHLEEIFIENHTPAKNKLLEFFEKHGDLVQRTFPFHFFGVI